MHLGFLIYAFYAVLGKVASTKQIFSPAFIGIYCAVFLILMIYAIIWQQVLKKIPLIIATANKTITIIWGILFGRLFFGEKITPNMIIGGAIILTGILILSFEPQKKEQNMLEIIPYIGFLFISVIISAYSQILLKKSAQKTYKSFFKEYINPYVICGYGIFFMAIFLDMLGLRKVPVSYIPIIESSSYVFIIIFSRIFLGEKINRRKTIAISAILLGIGIYLL